MVGGWLVGCKCGVARVVVRWPATASVVSATAAVMDSGCRSVAVASGVVRRLAQWCGAAVQWYGCSSKQCCNSKHSGMAPATSRAAAAITVVRRQQQGGTAAASSPTIASTVVQWYGCSRKQCGVTVLVGRQQQGDARAMRQQQMRGSVGAAAAARRCGCASVDAAV